MVLYLKWYGAEKSTRYVGGGGGGGGIPIHWSAVITSFFVFGVKVQLLPILLFLEGFGGGVNSEKLISFIFHVNFAIQIKIKGFNDIFY